MSVKRDAILDMWAAGEQTRTIAQKAGVNRNTVNRTVREMRAKGDVRALSRNVVQFNRNTDDRVIEMWAAGDMMQTIAEKLDIALRTVRNRIRAARLDGDPRAAMRKMIAPGRTADGRSEEILDLWAAGKQAPEIGPMVGVAPDVVHRVVTRARGRCDPRAVSRNPWYRKQETPTIEDEPRARLVPAVRVTLARVAMLDPEHIARFEAAVARRVPEPAE